jgi:hypothetical protein
MLFNTFIYSIFLYTQYPILYDKGYYYDENNDYYSEEENEYKDIAEYVDIYDDQWGDEIYDYDNYDDCDDDDNCIDNNHNSKI